MAADTYLFRSSPLLAIITTSDFRIRPKSVIAPQQRKLPTGKPGRLCCATLQNWHAFARLGPSLETSGTSGGIDVDMKDLQGDGTSPHQSVKMTEPNVND